MKKEKKHLFGILSAAAALAFLPSCTAAEVVVNGHPESVAEDDDIYYVACIGQQMNPTEKDGDGFIVTMNRRGGIISHNAFPGVRLDAPKGAVIEDGVLYVADVDRIVGISLQAGVIAQVVDLSATGTKYLNDIVEDDDFLYVSATDINKIFRVNLRNGLYEEIRTSEPLNAPNGLEIDNGLLYIAEFATNAAGAPAGKIKAVPVLGANPRPVSVVYAVPGMYDGILLKDEEDFFDNETDYLYFSDWAANGTPGAVKKCLPLQLPVRINFATFAWLRRARPPQLKAGAGWRLGAPRPGLGPWGQAGAGSTYIFRLWQSSQGIWRQGPWPSRR